MTKTATTFKRWVIVSADSLYVGQTITRAEMIARHVKDIHDASHGFAISGLNEEQRAAWKKCRANGDRCVRATIIVPRVIRND